jgi:hypothetical protein
MYDAGGQHAVPWKVRRRTLGGLAVILGPGEMHTATITYGLGGLLPVS